MCNKNVYLVSMITYQGLEKGLFSKGGEFGDAGAKLVGSKIRS